jgi:hypothetical protein
MELSALLVAYHQHNRVDSILIALYSGVWSQSGSCFAAAFGDDWGFGELTIASYLRFTTLARCELSSCGLDPDGCFSAPSDPS